MPTRRDLLLAGAGALAATAAAASAGCAAAARRAGPPETIVNDVQSQLNPTRVRGIARPQSAEELARALEGARREGRAVSACGARHAMGGQQFGTDTLLVDTSAMRRVLAFDPGAGVVEVEAGIQWPELVGWLLEAQRGRRRQWGIAQKQTGADRLSLGGSLGANVHGRGLTMRPIVADVESLVLVGPDGAARRVSRQQHADLFGLVVGGYGLFGVVASVRLRLVRRRPLERSVTLVDLEDLMPAFERRIAEGFLYGDWQYAIDPAADDFLRKGVFSCYRPVAYATPVPAVKKGLSVEQWRDLTYLAHVDPSRAFELYARHYLATNGQLYWSDLHQMGVYLEDYHRELDVRLAARERATEVITEIYVPRPALVRFLGEVRRSFRQEQVEVIYGTVRLIERDDETFLAWARDRFACVIFNLHTVHTPAGIERSARAFRQLIDLAIAHGGSYYPTYHRFATRQQVEACYPQFAEFLRRKRLHDPDERFQSDWYRHYRAMFG